MYDLMNEPLGTNITRERSLRQNFWDFSDALYRAIRAVDSRHIITMDYLNDNVIGSIPKIEEITDEKAKETVKVSGVKEGQK